MLVTENKHCNMESHITGGQDMLKIASTSGVNPISSKPHPENSLPHTGNLPELNLDACQLSPLVELTLAAPHQADSVYLGFSSGPAIASTQQMPKTTSVSNFYPTASLDKIWIEHPNYAYVPAVVLSRHDSGLTTVQLESGETFTFHVKTPVYVVPSCLEGPADLLALSQFDLGPILHSIRVRYFRNEIYTAISYPILISVNPYAALHKLYARETADKYRKAKSYTPTWTQSPMCALPDRKTLTLLSELDPHLFRVSQTAMNMLMTYGSNQSIIISGESGAGKTEATKIIISYLAEVSGVPYTRILSPKPSEFRDTYLRDAQWLSQTTLIRDQSRLMYEQHALSAKSEPLQASLEIQIAESNHLLESFGNAKSLRNDNSSRFGKFTQIHFNLRTHRIVKAEITKYLLEKSRIVQQQPEERNYHVFYQLCAGRDLIAPELRDYLQLDDASTFQYLSQCTVAQTIDDFADFEHLLVCFAQMGFQDAEVIQILRLLAGILHLGNVTVFPLSEHLNEGDKPKLETSVSNVATFQKVCELFGLDPDGFLKLHQVKSITDPVSHKIIYIRRDQTEVSAAKASLCRGIYDRLFDWLLKRINATLSRLFDAGTVRVHQEGSTQRRRRLDQPKDHDVVGKIGLLDIFGFEVFDLNSFEQLCINFANERLQQHFNAHMFHEEQVRHTLTPNKFTPLALMRFQLHYQSQGIDWTTIRFEDNHKVLDALTDRVSGLFPMLDSECILPKSTDLTFLSKIFEAAKRCDTLVTYSGVKRNDQFGVKHYAGPVVYSPHGLLEKNRDRVHHDVYLYFEGSEFPLLKDLFSSDPSLGCEETKRPGGVKSTGFTQTSVSFTFRKQLDDLLSVLGMTTATYVRCIKPNSTRASLVFDSPNVLRQLKCAGILESIRIRKDGYPVRVDVRAFLLRYKVLLNRSEKAQLIRDSGTFDHLKLIAEEFLKRLGTALISSGHQFDTSNGISIKANHQKELWQMGNSKLFLKDYFQQYLETTAEQAWSQYVTCISKHWKRYAAQQRCKRVLKAGRTIQSWCQFHTVRLAFKTYMSVRHEAATMIARAWRLHAQQRSRRNSLCHDNVSGLPLPATLGLKTASQCPSGHPNGTLSDEDDDIRDNAVADSTTSASKPYKVPPLLTELNFSRQFPETRHRYDQPCSENPGAGNRYCVQRRSSSSKHMDYAYSELSGSNCGWTEDQIHPPPFHAPSALRLNSLADCHHRSELQSQRLGPSDDLTSRASYGYYSELMTDRKNDPQVETVPRLLSLLQKANAQCRQYEAKISDLENDRHRKTTKLHQLQAEVEEGLQTKAETQTTLKRLREENLQLKGALKDQAHQREVLNAKLNDAALREELLTDQLDSQAQNIRMLIDHIENNSDASHDQRVQFEKQVDQLQADLNEAYALMRMVSWVRKLVYLHVRQKNINDKKHDDAGGLQSHDVASNETPCLREECRELRHHLAQLQSAVFQSSKRATLMRQRLYMRGQELIAELRSCCARHVPSSSPHLDHLCDILHAIVFDQDLPSTDKGGDSLLLKTAHVHENAHPVPYQAAMSPRMQPSTSRVPKLPQTKQRRASMVYPSMRTPQDLIQLTSRTLMTTSRVSTSPPRIQLEPASSMAM